VDQLIDLYAIILKDFVDEHAPRRIKEMPREHALEAKSLESYRTE